MAGVFVKSGHFLDPGCIMYSISIFFILHFTYWGVRTHPTNPLLPTGLLHTIFTLRISADLGHKFGI